MAVDLSEVLVIGISSRALFDLDAEDQIFKTQGLQAYSQYQRNNEGVSLNPGTAFHLIKSILRLNARDRTKRRVEVIMMSQNNADAGLRIFKSIKQHSLDITRGAFTSGASISPYLHAFNVDLFLSADDKDVQDAIDAGVAAARIYNVPSDFNPRTNQIRIAFDGDAVIFSDDSEKIYQKHGLAEFSSHEQEHATEPLLEGPFAKLLKTIATLQKELSDPKDPENSPIRIALITARNAPAHERVIRTLRAWGVRIDEMFFMGGVAKTKILEAFSPHIFFDDQDDHVQPASEKVPSAIVPYRTVPNNKNQLLAHKPYPIPHANPTP